LCHINYYRRFKITMLHFVIPAEAGIQLSNLDSGSSPE
jgi:hypothetical protein